MDNKKIVQPNHGETSEKMSRDHSKSGKEKRGSRTLGEWSDQKEMSNDAVESLHSSRESVFFGQTEMSIAGSQELQADSRNTWSDIGADIAPKKTRVRQETTSQQGRFAAIADALSDVLTDIKQKRIGEEWWRHNTSPETVTFQVLWHLT